MSVLLRHPDIVPALFSRAVGEEPAEEPRAVGWRRRLMGVPTVAAPLGLVSAWAAAAVVDVTLVRAAVAAVRLTPH